MNTTRTIGEHTDIGTGIDTDCQEPPDKPRPAAPRSSCSLSRQQRPFFALGAAVLTTLMLGPTVGCVDNGKGISSVPADPDPIASSGHRRSGATTATERRVNDRNGHESSPTTAPHPGDGDLMTAMADDESPDTSISRARLIVADALGRYDDAVTALALDPVSAADPDSTVRRNWDEIVPTGSFLHDDVLERMVDEPLRDGTRLLTGPEGVSYRHHVMDIAEVEPGYIRFSWCGYSPGVRVTRDTDIVVDDYVATMAGVGRVALRTTVPHTDMVIGVTGAGGAAPASGNPTADSATDASHRWILDELDHLDFDVLPPGTSDPCN